MTGMSASPPMVHSSIALNVLGARVAISSDSESADLMAHVRADFGLYEVPAARPDLPAPAAHIRVHQKSGWSEIELCQLPPDALLCSYDPVRNFQWWQKGAINYEAWGQEALIVSDRDQDSDIFCREEISTYPLVRAEIVRCLRNRLNQQNMLLFHAGLAAARDGRQAVLIPGVKSQGKTSTVLWLVESGLALHSDEIVLCSPSPEAYRFCGVPRRFALTEAAIRQFFPQYGAALSAQTVLAPFTGEEKHVFHVGEAHPTRPPEFCAVTMLVRPQLWRSTESEIQPLAPDEVQRVLYGSCEFNHLRSNRLEQITRELADRIQGYRLMIGQDSRKNYSVLNAHLKRHGLIL
jgi:hypothetical protein